RPRRRRPARAGRLRRRGRCRCDDAQVASRPSEMTDLARRTEERAPRVTVVGSLNLDVVARAERLPRVEEARTDRTEERPPGGKSATEAVAAARLGAQVRFVGAVGADAFADEALAGMREAGVELELVHRDATGVALILVDAAGENAIVVAPGANVELGSVDEGG